MVARLGGKEGGFWPFRRRPEEDRAARLLETVTRISRQPGFFGPGRVPDSLQGRAEIMFLHGGLALRRLRAAREGKALAQAFTDQFFSLIDAGLREDGVGDLSVPKKMHKLAGAFYGRLQAYDSALTAGDQPALAAALGRNVLGNAAAPFAADLARHATETAAGLAATPIDELDRFESWRAAPL